MLLEKALAKLHGSYSLMVGGGGQGHLFVYSFIHLFIYLFIWIAGGIWNFWLRDTAPEQYNNGFAPPRDPFPEEANRLATEAC